MSYSFEYIDIILLAMIAGFIFLRLRGILGKKTGYEENVQNTFQQDISETNLKSDLKVDSFDEKAKKDFLSGAKVAYETIITNFSKGQLKDIKSLLDKNIYNQFEEAIKDRKSKNILEVTVEFVSEIIYCIKDKDNKVISGDPETVKKVHDIWKFSKDIRSPNPNWFLIETQA